MKAVNSNCMQEKPMHIRKFKRKKDGKVVEAIHCSGDLATVYEVIIPWLGRGNWSGAIVLERGDWLVNCGTTIPYSCTPEAFAERFEPVEEPNKHTDKPNAKPEPKTQNLTFGEALELMKKGYRVSRVEWNMNGMWLSLSCNPNGDAVSGRREIAFENFWSNNNSEYARQNGGSAAVLPCITMKTTTGEILFGWAPSQTDMLANDWVWLNQPK